MSTHDDEESDRTASGGRSGRIESTGTERRDTTAYSTVASVGSCWRACGSRRRRWS